MSTRHACNYSNYSSIWPLFAPSGRAAFAKGKACAADAGCDTNAVPNLVNSFFSLLAALAYFSAATFVKAADPFFKTNDVVALIGGEDMVAAAESGHLESLLVRAMPDARLRFRSLAWEGDTVFEQPRDLNYPTLEQQLDEIGATVVIVQFGQMESLAGESSIAAFAAAYGKLVDQLASGGKRRLALIAPTPVAARSPAARRFKFLEAYSDAVREVAAQRGLRFVAPDDRAEPSTANFRDGIHLSDEGQAALASRTAEVLSVNGRAGEPASTDALRFGDSIRAKNRLWFHYTRPQNWAFLNGDRTSQPSSRDHRDPSKRWFPEEMKQWLPLIDAKEQEIAKLAAHFQSK